MCVLGLLQARMVDNANRTLRGNLINSATAWWMVRLSYYEMITAHGYILYPRDIIWQDVYAIEFVPEMRMLGHNWKDPMPREKIQLDDDEMAPGAYNMSVPFSTTGHTHKHRLHMRPPPIVSLASPHRLGAARLPHATRARAG